MTFPRIPLALAFVVGLLVQLVSAAAGDAGMDMSRLVPKLIPSVVAIETKSMRTSDATEDPSRASASNLKVSFGTGFIIDPDGYIVTNRHVIDNAYDIIVSFNDGTRLNATLVGKGRSYDLALLKVMPIKPLQAAHFGDSDLMQVGDPVIAIGNPFGLGIAVSAGIVSALDRDLHFSRFDEFIQTDAAINHGNSGGPLFNMRGEVVGINTALYSSESGGGSVGIGYSIPASDAALLVPLLKKYGYLRVGSLEVLPQPVTADLAEALNVPQKGVLVTEIAPEGPAAGKLQLGDIILKIGNDEIFDQRGLYRHAGASLNQPLSLLVWRKGQTMVMSLTPVQVPEEAGHAPIDMPHPVAQNSETMRLGAEVAPITPENRKRFDIADDEKGVVVTSVLPDSPCAAGGLSVGDVIEMVQMESVTTPADGARQIEKAMSEGRRFIVGLVQRSKERRFVTIPLPRP